MNVCFVANDVAPSGAFKMVAPELERRGIKTTGLIAEGKPPKFSKGDIDSAISKSDLVVLGMSAPAKNAELEIYAAKKAHELGVPYSFYGDVAGCWGRAQEGNWFYPVARNTAFYFGVRDEDGVKDVFPNAHIFATGNPVRETEAFPVMSREEARKVLGVKNDEKLIMVPGSKFVGANFSILAVLFEALDFLHSDKIRLIFCPHPGDTEIFAVDWRKILKIYEDSKTQLLNVLSSFDQLFAVLNKVFNDSELAKLQLNAYQEFLDSSPVPARVITKDILSSAQAVNGADLVVEYGSSVAFMAVYRRIPLLTLPVIAAANRCKKNNGKRETEVMEDEVTIVASADNCLNLSEDIEFLLIPNSEDAEDLLASQEKKYPLPKERGEAVRKLADAITSL